MPGSLKVRFANGKGDDVLYFGGKVKEFSYSGRFEVGNLFGKNFAVINQD